MLIKQILDGYHLMFVDGKQLWMTRRQTSETGTTVQHAASPCNEVKAQPVQSGGVDLGYCFGAEARAAVESQAE